MTAAVTSQSVLSTLTISRSLAERMTDHDERFSEALAASRYGAEVTVVDVTVDDLVALREKTTEKAQARYFGALIATFEGRFETIKKADTAPALIEQYLRQDAQWGWVFRRGSRSDRLDAYLVTGIRYEPPTKDMGAFVTMKMAYTSPVGDRDQSSRSGRGTLPHQVSWSASEMRGKTPGDLLVDQGILRETPELHEEYVRQEEYFRQVLTTGFAGVYRYTGKPTPVGWRDQIPFRKDVRVVHDVHPDEIRSIPTHLGGILKEEGESVRVPLPLHFDLRVFDLALHKFYTVSGLDLKAHVFDESLRDKLVLPADQRELLDILTTDIETFTADIVEGKSAGNTILSKGVPGVGKTLTAEVYAEIMHKPLYSIHSGSLGVTADTVRSNLEEIFKRAARWDAVLLLDEADVFIIERGNNLEQNAIVAEFLRTMEYFDGLLFMTTNRADSIDEAIISRCAAIIDYRIPNREDAIKIWRVLSENIGLDMSEDLVADLWDGFREIAPRDIKMLLRLAVRVAAKNKEPLSVDLFRRCAMFRGLHYDTSVTRESLDA